MNKLKNFKNKWNTFKELKNCNYSIWIVTIIFDNLQTSTCTCPTFFKQFSCKQVLGMQICLKLVDVPPQVESVPFGQKRKRGCPALATKALIIQ